MRQGTCRVCGRAFVAAATGPVSPFCGRRCKSKAYYAANVEAERARRSAAYAKVRAKRSPAYSECPVCGRVFVPGRSDQRLCSKRCQNRLSKARYQASGRRAEDQRQYRARLAAELRFTCVECGKRFGAQKERARYCSQACVGVANQRRLAGVLRGPKNSPPPPSTPVVYQRCKCGRLRVVARNRSGGCGPVWTCQECRAPQQRRIWTAGVGAECAAAFVVLNGAGWIRFCSNRCGRAAARRRRNVRSGAQAERYSRRAVFERDRWVCQLCGKRVRRDKRTPHPLAPVLDHILPLAAGGGDTAANVQCAHYLCNSLKRDKTGPRGDQLRLVG